MIIMLSMKDMNYLVDLQGKELKKKALENGLFINEKKN